MKKRGPKTPPPKRLFQILLLTFSLLFAFLLAEIISRYLFNKRIKALTFSESDQYYYYEPNGFKRHIPNKVGYERLWDGKGKAEFRINSLGLRGPEVALPKANDVYRILFLGDSITLGGRLHEKDIFIRRIEAALNQNSQQRIEIINGGRGDIGLAEIESIWDEIGSKVQPDLVILCWFLNDNRPPIGFPEEKIYQNPIIKWFNRNTWFQKSYFLSLSYHRFQQRLVKKEMNFIRTKSQRFDWIDLYYKSNAWLRDRVVFQSLVAAAQFDWGDAWKEESLIQTAKDIRRIRDKAQKSGAPFLLAVTPVHIQLYAQFQDPFIELPQRALGSFAQEEKIPFFNLLPVLRQHINKQIFYDHCHYTPFGNKIVADGFLGFIRDSVPALAKAS